MSTVPTRHHPADGSSAGAGPVIDNGLGVVLDRKCLLRDKYPRLIPSSASCSSNGMDGLPLVDDNRDYRESASVFFFVFRRLKQHCLGGGYRRYRLGAYRRNRDSN